MSEVETAEEDRSQCEPRSNLLWRIVGQATSADWQHSSRQSAKHSQGCPRLQTVHTADSPASDEYNDSQQNTARLLEQQSHEKQTPIAAELSSEELGATAVASIVYHGRPQAAGYSDHQTCWRQLPVEVVPAIAAAAGDPAVLLRLSGVCRCATQLTTTLRLSFAALYLAASQRCKRLQPGLLLVISFSPHLEADVVFWYALQRLARSCAGRRISPADNRLCQDACPPVAWQKQEEPAASACCCLQGTHVRTD